jgi:hypothetical protein
VVEDPGAWRSRAGDGDFRVVAGVSSRMLDRIRGVVVVVVGIDVNDIAAESVARDDGSR